MKIPDLTTLIRWLAEAHIDTFELEAQGVSLRIVMQGQLEQAVERGNRSVLPSGWPRGRLHHVIANAKGTFLTAHPLRASSLVCEGDVVAVGDVLALLRVTDVVYEAVLADRDGQVVRTLAAAGQPIEKGIPLFELNLRKSRNLTSLRQKKWKK